MDSNVQLVKNLLKYTFGLVPIVAGLDKFTNILTNWSQYISEGFAEMLSFEPTTFMIIVGIIEIIAGILVLTKTKLGAYVVSGWLVAIALTLIFSWSYIDVAVRDIVMAIAAFSLAKLSENNFSRAKN
ncbi:DoxX family membrane protein [Winogradskyella sp.]|uniref:DoxX family membrane protein n=1 Tax=Winogradskyella sp. TaxID=1883156 RepID=UPI0025FCC960|nr:DoxX family membrane protein [Winogradskyella sp.]